MALERLKAQHLKRSPDAPRDDLLAQAQKLIEETETTPNLPQFTSAAHVRKAELLLHAGRFEEAAAEATRAFEVLPERMRHDQGISPLVLLAKALAQSERWPEVSRATQQGIDLIEPFRRKVTPLYLQSAYLRFRIDLYNLRIRAACMLGQCEVALETADLVKCRALSTLTQEGRSDHAEWERLRQQFRAVCVALDRANLNQETADRLEAERQALWDAMAIARAGGRTSQGEPVSLGQLRAQLRPEEAVLYYFWIDPRRLLVAAIDRAGVVSQVIEIDEAKRRLLLDKAQAALGFVWNDPVKGQTNVLVPGPDVSELLFPQAVVKALEGKSSLIVSPHRMLHSVPLHACTWGGQFAIERYAFTYCPNLGAAARTRPVARPSAVLGVGVAQHQGPFRDRTPPIPDAEQEISEVGEVYRSASIPCDLRLGPDAREAALDEDDSRQRLRRYSVLSFACHGLSVDSDLPMTSKLFLHDTVLDGLDLSAWELDADVVALSACSSGQRPFAGRGLQELPGDDLFGLQAAFFMAGARQILGTMWPVKSGTARAISVAFHRRLAAGRTAARALQEAIKEHLADAGTLRRQPAYWAPFFLVALTRTTPQRDEEHP
jgi:CHAT domain-containing protein